MQWELAHRPRGVYTATHVTLEAQNGWAAVEQLREAIEPEELILYVRTAD